MTQTKRWIWNRYFHFKKDDQESRDKAEVLRYQIAENLMKTLESKSRLSIIAKDKNEANSYLTLRGFVNFNNSMNRERVKRMIGRYSNCKPAVFGDTIMLTKYFVIDKHLSVGGVLPSQGNNGSKTMKAYATDAKWLVKVLLDEVSKQNFDK